VVPGKKYAPEDFLKIAWRRKWLLIVPLVLAGVGTFIYSRGLPNRYRSEAVVLIIPQQVPENFIRPTVDETIAARLDLMRQQILSRARLDRIIEEFNLYAEERKVMLMDQIIDQMLDDINVAVQKVGRRQDPNHFVVSFDSKDPQTAMQVAGRLASLFVRENIEGRNIQTDATTQFLQSQVDESLRQLQQQESRLETFKKTHAGRLPSEVATNIELMSNTRQQIQTLNDGISRDRERQIEIGRQIADEMTFVPTVPAGRNGPGGQTDESALPVTQQLAAARAGLQNLRTRLKEDHPDVQIMRRRIEDLEQKAEAEALQQPVGVSASLTPAEAERQKRLSQLRGEHQRLEREIRMKQQGLQRAQATLSENERRVQAASGLESQLTDLMRGHETLRSSHDKLLAQLQQAKLASSLEQRQVSQQLRIIDPARRPDRPHSPDRARMNVIGALVGLGLGLVIAGLLEYRDSSLRTEEDVLVALSLPVLALVPTMSSGKALRGGRRRRLLGSPGTAMILACFGSISKMRLFEGWGL
jgi:polysaccharide chain length determinant protein (PEP-CTERM system associated)